jgi:hypothetical protein
MDFRYYHQLAKLKLAKFIENSVGRLFTSQTLLLMTLDAQGLLPKAIKAFEPFGGYGLQTVPDYIDRVQSLDIVEWNEKIFKRLAKHYKSNPKVKAYCGDCMKFMAETPNTYNFIVTDTMFLPDNFLSVALKLLEPGGIMLFRSPLEAFADFGETSAKITSLAPVAPVAIFPWVKNKSASYAVVIMPRNYSL